MQISIKNESLFNIRRDIGVYLIRCMPLNRIYVGSTNQSFRARFSNHCKFLKHGNLGNKKLQEDYNLYGPENFEFEILGIYPENLTVHYETHFKKLLNAYYNKNISCNNSKTNEGKKFSEEHRDKIREKSKLFKHTNLESISKQNKEGANKFKITNIISNEEFFINSRLELNSFLGIKDSTKYYNSEYKKYKIEVLKTQKKGVKLLVNNVWIEFSSFEKCDRFLNRWRGYTSTKSLKKVTILDGYDVVFD